MKPVAKVKDQLGAPVRQDSLTGWGRASAAASVGAEEPHALDECVEWAAMFAILHADLLR